MRQKRLAAFPSKYQNPYPTTRQPTSRRAVRGSARVQSQSVNKKPARKTARPSPLPVGENIPSAPEPVHSRARLAKYKKTVPQQFCPWPSNSTTWQPPQSKTNQPAPHFPFSFPSTAFSSTLPGGVSFGFPDSLPPSFGFSGDLSDGPIGSPFCA